MSDCKSCDGVGERFTGRREPDTNAPIMAECYECHGSGEAPWLVDYTTEGWVRPE